MDRPPGSAPQGIKDSFRRRVLRTTRRDLVKATQTPHGAHTRTPSILFTFVSWLVFEKYLYAYRVTGVILALYR